MRVQLRTLFSSFVTMLMTILLKLTISLDPLYIILFSSHYFIFLYDFNY